jgi:hypothetical protein
MECGKKINQIEKNELDDNIDNFIENHLSTKSIKWPLVLPVSIAIGLLGAAAMGPIFLLIIILGLVLVGYLIKEPKKGALNGLVTGAILFL